MVLELFLREPAVERYGREIIEISELKSGSLYPILHRLESNGFLVSSWEDSATAIAAQRRPRRRYRLSADGAAAAQDAFAAWQKAQRGDSKVRGVAPGGLAS